MEVFVLISCDHSGALHLQFQKVMFDPEDLESKFINHRFLSGKTKQNSFSGYLLFGKMCDFHELSFLTQLISQQIVSLFFLFSDACNVKDA